MQINGVVDANDPTLQLIITSVLQDEVQSSAESCSALVNTSGLLLRSERAGTGDGRVYVIGFTATNDAGQSCSGTVKVSVPHSKKKGSEARDSGSRFPPCQ